MKNVYLLLPVCAVFANYTLSGQVAPDNIVRCSTIEYIDYKKSIDPMLEQRMANDEKELQQYIADNSSYKTTGTVVIPVVVHVVYNTSTENISDAQIRSQIDVLNEDYSRTNADTTNTPSAWKAIAGDPGIQFCLASRDADGNWTNGIVRKHTTKTGFSPGSNDVHFSSNGGDDAWDVSQYFNIWVCNLQGGAAGFSEPPSTTHSSTFGPVILYKCFGRTGTLLSAYSKGRTTTHEVGHCFALYHIWGDDGGGCDGDDYCADTPGQTNYTSSSSPVFPRTDACSPSGNGVMFMNFMDYTQDKYLNMFTKVQAERINKALDKFYPSLKTSNGCQAPTSIKESGFSPSVSVYPNPTEGTLSVSFNSSLTEDIQVNIYNVVGDVISSAVIVHSNSRIATFDLSDQPNGTYFVGLRSNLEIVTKRLIISK